MDPSESNECSREVDVAETKRRFPEDYLDVPNKKARFNYQNSEDEDDAQNNANNNDDIDINDIKYNKNEMLTNNLSEFDDVDSNDKTKKSGNDNNNNGDNGDNNNNGDKCGGHYPLDDDINNENIGNNPEDVNDDDDDDDDDDDEDVNISKNDEDNYKVEENEDDDDDGDDDDDDDFNYNNLRTNVNDMNDNNMNDDDNDHENYLKNCDKSSDYNDDIIEIYEDEDNTDNDDKVGDDVDEEAGNDVDDNDDEARKHGEGGDDDSYESCSTCSSEEEPGDIESVKMQILVSNFSEDQLNRYTLYRRSTFAKAAVKRLMQGVSGVNVPQNLVIAMSGIAKVLAAQVIETALDIQEEWGGTEGPTTPPHIREALRRVRATKKMTSTKFKGRLL